MFFKIFFSFIFRLLVGAPLDQNLQPNTSKSGALWKCPLTMDMNDCVQVVTDGKIGMLLIQTFRKEKYIPLQKSTQLSVFGIDKKNTIVTLNVTQIYVVNTNAKFKL